MRIIKSHVAFVSLVAVVFCLGEFALAGRDPNTGLITSCEGESQLFVRERLLGQETWTHVQYEGKRYFARRAVPGDHVPVGSVLHNGTNGKIRFVYANGDQVNIGPSSSLLVEARDSKSSAKKTSLNLYYGKIRAVVKKKGSAVTGARDFQVKTRAVVAGVRGTDFIVSYGSAAGSAEVAVLRGAVEMKPDGAAQASEVKGGFAAVVKAPSGPAPLESRGPTGEAVAKQVSIASGAQPSLAGSTSVSSTSSQVEVKPLTKEGLAEIHKFSHMRSYESEELKSVPAPVAAEIRDAEKQATKAVIEDIQSADPQLAGRLTADGTAVSAAQLNAAVIGQQMQFAPAEQPASKKLQKELRELDQEVYDRYFKIE